MYQIQVKLNLIKKEFLPEDGWEVTVDIDAMEMGERKAARARLWACGYCCSTSI